MFIMDMPPEQPREVPVLMAQADNGKRGDGGMQDLSPLPTIDVPQHYASVMIAQANQVQIASTYKERAIGVCYGIYNPVDEQHPDLLSPQGAAADYFSLYEKRTVDAPPLSNVELVVQPKHGKVVYSTYRDGLLHPTYIPESGYEGDEKFVFKVSVDGTTVRVVYLLKVTRMFTDSEGVHDYLCKDTGTQWKISQPNVPADITAMQSLLKINGSDSINN